jgi:hypothetical protein
MSYYEGRKQHETMYEVWRVSGWDSIPERVQSRYELFRTG